MFHGEIFSLKKIVLGTAQFSGNYGITKKNSFLAENEAHKILKTLLSKKLKHLDTSIDYENSLNKINSFNFNNPPSPAFLIKNGRGSRLF